MKGTARVAHTAFASTLAWLLFLTAIAATEAAKPCATDSECQAWIGPESRCLPDAKTCSNRFVDGCLQAFDKTHPKRICNSNDADAAATTAAGGTVVPTGDCEPALAFNYTEIRVHHGNWESSIFYSWILQIVLSERLNVPVIIGYDGDIKNSFYSPTNTMEFSPETYPFSALEVANHVHDCRNLDTNNPVLKNIVRNNPKDCVHVLPEVWSGATQQTKVAVRQEIIDPLEGDGQVGKISWYIPLFTARQFPEFTSYHGLTEGTDSPINVSSAEASPMRKRLASIFKRPITWEEYCTQVSESKCEQPDDFASRRPASDTTEGSRYFFQGSYRGYFRETAENNCAKSPTCTGHIVAPPCSWSSFIDAQLYWNNIPVSSSGPNDPNGSYTYGQMIDIWKAANATESHVLMWWWTPEALVEDFRGTDYSFQKILLPDATSVCKRSRVSAGDRCSLDDEDRRGSIEGSCDSEAHALQKAIVASLGKHTFSTPLADRSPAYSFLRSFKIDNLDMNEILQNWISMKNDPQGHDPRQAVCQWVRDNLDTLDDFVPLGYPRELVVESVYDEGYLIVAQVFGSIVAACVVLVGAMVYYRRQTRVMVFAQVYFMLLLIGGYFLVAMAAIVYVIEPSSPVCIGREWLMAVGYTLELVPLVVKFAALNKVVQSTRKMKRVRISAKVMFCKVAALVLTVMLYLTVWTVVDAPKHVEERELVEENGTQVKAYWKCDSQSWLWEGLALGWQGLLLLMATILAVQTLTVQQEFNESRSLGTLVYSHFMFIILRIMVNVLEDQGTIVPTVSSATISYLLSIDVFFGMCIYLAPKLIEAKNKPQPYHAKKDSSSPETNPNNNHNTNNRTRTGTNRNRPHTNSMSAAGRKRSSNGHSRSSLRRTGSNSMSSQPMAPSIRHAIHDDSNDDSLSENSTEDRFGSSIDEIIGVDQLNKVTYDISSPIIEEPDQE